MIDFGVRDIDGRLAVLIEAKARRRTSPHWAAEFRRNLAAHSLQLQRMFRDAMFVLATPQVLYIWPPAAAADALPAYEVDATEVLAPYLRHAGVGQGFVDPTIFEMIVHTWLTSVSSGVADVPDLLKPSGLVDRLRGGTVTASVAA